MTQYQIYGGTRSSRKKVLLSFGLGGLRKFMYLVALGLISSVIQTAAAADTDFSIGNKLADMLRASRNVISASQGLINDPDIGDKGFTGEKFVREVEAIYQERVGTSLLEDDLPERDRRLLEAQMQAMRRVIDRHQADINRPDVGFKGFIPAIFARLANEEFRMIVGSEARIRVTAPSNLVRNRKARPDRWEKNILETKLMTSDWPKGKPYIEVAELEGRPAFRMLLPEYYSESCLACHGEPKGETDITGYPMEGGKVGELGSVISIVIFR